MSIVLPRRPPLPAESSRVRVPDGNREGVDEGVVLAICCRRGWRKGAGVSLQERAVVLRSRKAAGVSLQVRAVFRVGAVGAGAGAGASTIVGS